MSAKVKWKTPTYVSWDNMLCRCRPSSHHAKYYASRGIAVCERWKTFANFLADMGERPLGHELDRIDNDGGYCKENCRWATRSAQNRNKQNNHLWTFRGKTQCIQDWAEETGIAWLTLKSRFLNGWTIEEILSTPIRPIRKTSKRKATN